MSSINTILFSCEAFKLFQQEETLLLKSAFNRACVNNYFLEWILSFCVDVSFLALICEGM